MYRSSYMYTIYIIRTFVRPIFNQLFFKMTSMQKKDLIKVLLQREDQYVLNGG